MTKYPEHEKLNALDGANELIGQFLEWLEQGYAICEWVEEGDNGKPRLRWKASRIGKPRRALPCTQIITISLEPDRVDEFNGDAESNPDYEWWPSGYVRTPKRIDELLAEYFEIDRDRLDAEKTAMLDELRAANERREQEASESVEGGNAL